MDRRDLWSCKHRADPVPYGFRAGRTAPDSRALQFGSINEPAPALIHRLGNLTNRSTQSKEEMKITRVGMTPSMTGPADWFTGAVRVDSFFPADGGRQSNGGVVTFSPGARTRWHTHPAGQTIIITQGLGWVQREGDRIEEVKPGDVVFFEPHEKHWHGASAQVGMVHIAITETVNGKAVDWLEPVSDQQYGG